MLNAVIRAPLLSLSGYGVHSRQVFMWLEKTERFKITTQPVQWGSTTWLINPDYENGLIGRIMELTESSSSSQQYDISFQVQLPDEWDPNLANINVGITAAVETDRCNPDWIQCVNRMDAIIVPSNHTKAVLTKTGNVKCPVYIVPEWYISEIDDEYSDEPSDDRLDIDLDTDFNFLIVGSFTGNSPECDRKNIYFTVKWFCESFSNDPDVGLVIKTNHGKGTRIDRQITRNKIRALISEVRVGKYPKIYLLHGNLHSSEIVDLYRNEKIKCLLSLTRGEGFGLPLLEASACEVPVIATNWSAHLDFLNCGKFIPIDYKLIEISQNRIDGRIFIKGTQWAEPSEEDFKKKVVKFRNKYLLPQQWAKDLSHQVKEKFSSSSIMKNYDEVLSKILE